MAAANVAIKSAFILLHPPFSKGEVFPHGVIPSFEKHALSKVEGREGEIFLLFI